MAAVHPAPLGTHTEAPAGDFSGRVGVGHLRGTRNWKSAVPKGPILSAPPRSGSLSVPCSHLLCPCSGQFAIVRKCRQKGTGKGALPGPVPGVQLLDFHPSRRCWKADRPPCPHSGRKMWKTTMRWERSWAGEQWFWGLGGMGAFGQCVPSCP